MSTVTWNFPWDLQYNKRNSDEFTECKTVASRLSSESPWLAAQGFPGRRGRGFLLQSAENNTSLGPGYNASTKILQGNAFCFLGWQRWSNETRQTLMYSFCGYNLPVLPKSIPPVASFPTTEQLSLLDHLISSNTFRCAENSPKHSV